MANTPGAKKAIRKIARRTEVRVRRLQQVPGPLPERAAEEPELEGHHHGLRAADRRPAADHRLLLAGAPGGTGA